jgi:DNA primase
MVAANPWPQLRDPTPARCPSFLGGTATNRSLFETLADVGVDHVILALDNDRAGRIATTKAIDHAVKAARSPTVWVIDPDLLGTAKDPGQLVHTCGRDAWLEARAAPVCAVTWRALDLTVELELTRLG